MADFKEYLEKRYQKEVEWYDNKSLHNKRMAISLQITLIASASIVVALAALGLKWLTIIASTIVAVTSGVLQYCKYEELWHTYRTVCETLRKEKHLFDFKIGEYQSASEPEKVFVQRIESLISKENTDWVFQMSKSVEKHKGYVNASKSKK